MSDIWLLKEGNCFRNQVINMCGDNDSKQKHQLKFDGGNLETIRRIVDSQYGFTIIPELASLEMTDAQKEKIKFFPSPEPVREVSLIVRRSFMKRKLLNLLQDEILASIPEKILKNDKSQLITWRS
jgi:LysR family hydrogen peroxide-inducible transcriptional activator